MNQMSHSLIHHRRADRRRRPGAGVIRFGTLQGGAEGAQLPGVAQDLALQLGNPGVTPPCVCMCVRLSDICSRYAAGIIDLFTCFNMFIPYKHS